MVCECGGDCNTDGVIFGSEISTALNVLVGVAPLSVCPAADINGDGSVMGAEINLALSNLAQGCPDLLTPLSGLGQSRAGDMVTFNVGSASGAPGDTVNVAIDVHGGMGEIVMAQVDLLYDPTTLTIADATSACRLDARLGQQIVRTSTPDTPAAPAGRARLRIFVGDLTLPADVFGEGTLVSCAFQIAGNAAGGSTEVLGDHLNVSDANANSFGTEALAGAVEIVVPTPVPEAPTEAPTAVPTEVPPPPATATPEPPPPTEDTGECIVAADCGADRRQACVESQCVCAGDCDGNGDTLVSELVAAVNVVLGQSPLGACAAADVSGDGVVSVDELLVGLGNVTRGCPAR
jgi:hypothetical protein